MIRNITMLLLATSLGGAQIKLPGNLTNKLPGKTAAKTEVKTDATAAAFTPNQKVTVDGQSVELTLCERAAADPKVKNDVMAVNPTTTFASKGTVTNVFGVFRFDPPLTGTTKHTLKVIANKGGSFEDDRDITFTTGGRTGAFGMTLKPGRYELQIVNKFDQAKLYMKASIVVSEDTVGARATDNMKSGAGKLMFCKEVDDNWKCVGEATKWKANQPFNTFVELPTPAGVTLTRWVIHKQKSDGTDGAFVDEQMQNIGETRFRKWATTEGWRLPAGVYTIYSIASQQAQTTEHSGNLKNYFAKATVTIQ